MPDTIPFELRLTLVPHLKDQKIRIDYQDQMVIVDKVDTEIVVNLNFEDLVDSIKILQVSGFEPDPDCNIKITNVSINGYSVKDFYHLMSFDMKDNPYMKNESINQVAMLDFNGSLNLEIKKNIKRFRWSQFVFSKNRHGMIYRNSILGCTSEHGCCPAKECHHDDPWQLFDIDKFADKDHYDTVALGCSITAGTGILKDQCWPSLLKSNGHKVLNLGIPGGGIDSIFINTINIIKNGTKFDQLIILLPSMARQLVRVPRHGMTFNFLTTPQSGETNPDNHFNIYFSKEEIHDLVKKHTKNIVMSDYVSRNKKLIKRLISCLESAEVRFKISSWADETYEVLNSCVAPNNLLPKFNEKKDKSTGIDGHPSEKIHQKWVYAITSML